MSEGEYAQVTEYEIQKIKGKRGFPWNGLEPVFTAMYFRRIRRDENTRGNISTALFRCGWQVVCILSYHWLFLSIFPSRTGATFTSCAPRNVLCSRCTNINACISGRDASRSGNHPAGLLVYEQIKNRTTRTSASSSHTRDCLGVRSAVAPHLVSMC